MKEYNTGRIRNVALISHNGAGKTTFVERLLFNAGITTRMGSSQTGTAAMDFEEEEIERNSSIATAIAPIESADYKINFLDTPGYIDFVGEVNSALHVANGALVFVEAVAGVEVGTELVWQYAEGRHLPRMVVISKMDRENVRISRVMNGMKESLPGNFVDLQLPIGEGSSFQGVVDLISLKSYGRDGEAPGEVPANLAEAVAEARMALVEAAAEADDALLEKYFEDEELTAEEIATGLKKAMLAGSAVPVLYTAAEPGIATDPILKAVTALMPAPDETGPFSASNARGETETHPVSDSSPLAAFVFKSREDAYGKMSYLRLYGGVLESDSRVWDANLEAEARVGTINIVTGKQQAPVARLHSGDIGMVVKLGDTATNHTLCQRNHVLKMAPIQQPDPIDAVAIHPESQSDVAKLSASLNRLVAEDPTLHWRIEPATRETILSGMGTAHLDIAIKKARSKFGVNMTTSVPKIPYRETVTGTSSAEYTHKKQTGGAGQYARVFLRVESLPDDQEFEFASEVFGGAISGPFVVAVEKGCRQALQAGPLAGFPMVGVKAVVYDGKEHPVDSKEIAFQIAGREVFKKASHGAGLVLLEPIYEISVTVPTDNMGDIMGDFNTRRARVLGMEQVGNKSVINAEVPLAEAQTYAADLRSMTQGRGIFSMKFLRYGRVPGHIQEQIVAARRKELEEEAS